MRRTSYTGRHLTWWISALILAVAPVVAQNGGAKATAPASAAPASPSVPAAAATATTPAPGVAASAPVPSYAPPSVGHYGPSGPWMMVRTLFALGLVVGLIYLTAWAAKAKGGITAAPSGYRLRVVETIALAPNRSLHLVAVGQQVLLLGAGTDGMRTLATFSAEELGYDPDSAVPPAESFMAKLQAYRGGGGEQVGR
ncbi:MAG: FliO/MopB family protein [Armatimonadetes bacterium]|nr:FliO/MopB family protein [Armatimonadota bacterium]